MFERLRIPLPVVNAVQSGFVAGIACVGAWLVLPGERSALQTQALPEIAARNLAGAIDRGLKSVETDARSAALLLQETGRLPDEAQRAGTLRQWLDLHPGYTNVMLLGADGSVRQAGAPGITHVGKTWFRRAKGAHTIVATEGGTAYLGVALGGDYLVLRVAPAWFDELAAGVRTDLGAHAPNLVLSVIGADGVPLFGMAPSRPPPADTVQATVQTGGSGDLASAGWAVTSVLAVPEATPHRPTSQFTLLVLALMAGAAGLGFTTARRPARRLNRLSGAPDAEPGPVGASRIAEIGDLERTRGLAGSRDDRGLREALTNAGRIRTRLRTFEAMSGWTLWEVDPSTRQVVWTDPGRGPASAGDLSMDLTDLIDGILPADRPLMRLTMDTAMAEDGPHDVILRTSRAHPDGDERRLLVRFRRGDVAEDGGVRLLALSREMGEDAEPARAVNERRRDGALRRVTDGIVHNINNALTVVTANLQILTRRHPLGEAEARLVDSALAGAARGTALTRRMASVVRSNAATLAEADLGATVVSFLPFLQSQVLGEMPVMNRVPADLPPVRCSEQVLEVLLLNLAFYFRDGGFDGFAVAGRVHEIGSALPPGLDGGAYVRLVLVGGRPARMRPEPKCGPDPDAHGGVAPLDAVMRLAEEVGGRFVIQSDGSDLRHFAAELWLPAAIRAAPPVTDTPVPGGSPAERVLRILLVESDSLVRSCLAESLADLGHDVVQAASGSHALEALAGAHTFDVMITDHAMPVMSGLQLAATVVEHHPGIHVILAGPHGHLPGPARRFPHLDKPFQQDDLAAMLATIAAAPRARAA